MVFRTSRRGCCGDGDAADVVATVTVAAATVYNYDVLVSTIAYT
jgi:hypothetical protein